MAWFLLFLLLGVAVAALAVWRMRLAMQRERYIREFELPRGLFDALRRKRPQLGLKECQLVAKGLRQFFLAYLKSGRAQVSMPSQLADELWHEFILYTRNYEVFCQRAFGRFLHHTPAVVLGGAAVSNAGLRRVWWYTCKEDNINPRQPTRLPLLFALDGKFGIPDGFRYVADCEGLRRQQGDGTNSTVIHCGGDFSDAGFDGAIDGFGDAHASDAGAGFSTDGGGSGGDGGCGGGGCGS